MGWGATPNMLENGGKTLAYQTFVNLLIGKHRESVKRCKDIREDSRQERRRGKIPFLLER
jgi:hypothetical protein